jgi:hypothetical protein
VIRLVATYTLVGIGGACILGFALVAWTYGQLAEQGGKKGSEK